MPYLTYQEDGQDVLVIVADGVDLDAEAARVVPQGRTFKKHPTKPVLTEKVRVPQSVPMHHAKIVLSRAGRLAGAEAAAQAAGGETLIAWTSSPSISRKSPTMRSVQGVLGMSDAEVDQLFIAAAALEV